MKKLFYFFPALSPHWNTVSHPDLLSPFKTHTHTHPRISLCAQSAGAQMVLIHKCISAQSIGKAHLSPMKSTDWNKREGGKKKNLHLLLPLPPPPPPVLLKCVSIFALRRTVPTFRRLPSSAASFPSPSKHHHRPPPPPPPRLFFFPPCR